MVRVFSFGSSSSSKHSTTQTVSSLYKGFSNFARYALVYLNGTSGEIIEAKGLPDSGRHFISRKNLEKLNYVPHERKLNISDIAENSSAIKCWMLLLIPGSFLKISNCLLQTLAKSHNAYLKYQ